MTLRFGRDYYSGSASQAACHCRTPALGSADTPAEVARLLERSLYACVPLGILLRCQRWPGGPEILAVGQSGPPHPMMGVGFAAPAGAVSSAILEAAKAAPPLSPIAWASLMTSLIQ